VSTKIPTKEGASKATSGAAVVVKNQFFNAPSNLSVVVEAVQNLSVENVTDKVEEIKNSIYYRYEAVGDRYDELMNSISRYWSR
jgi:hypothetical protein